MSGDAELMGRVRAGDEAALGALMERWELPVKGLIGRIVLNASEAEELAQEAFVRVWQQREKYRTGDAIAALPLELREAIVLFEYEQLSHAEIAVTVGATAKAVETRIYRAREKLRTSLRRWV